MYRPKSFFSLEFKRSWSYFQGNKEPLALKTWRDKFPFLLWPALEFYVSAWINIIQSCKISKQTTAVKKKKNHVFKGERCFCSTFETFAHTSSKCRLGWGIFVLFYPQTWFRIIDPEMIKQMYLIRARAFLCTSSRGCNTWKWFSN